MQLAVSVGREKYLRDRAAAAESAEKFWKETKKRGPVAIDPQTLETLNRKPKSVQKFFSLLVQFQLSGKSNYLRDDDTAHGTRVIVETPGGRRWSHRTLQSTFRMASETIQHALKACLDEDLCFVETSRKWGTYILVKNFSRFVRRNGWRGAVKAPSSSVSENDTFDLKPNVSCTLTDPVNAPAAKKEGDTLEKRKIPPSARSELLRLFPEFNWGL